MPNVSLQIAIIDDEELIRRALTRLLGAAGINSQGYASGQEFLATWRHNPPDCVVMDLQMPGLSGFDVLQCLKNLGADMPIIIITAHDEPAMKQRCLQAGASTYLRKPLDDEVLINTIESLCGSPPTP
ncbi:MAG: response regulator [Spongiibacteraceae bacterium]